MGSQGEDGLGAPLKNLMCRVYRVGGRRGGSDDEQGQA